MSGETQTPIVPNQCSICSAPHWRLSVQAVVSTAASPRLLSDGSFRQRRGSNGGKDPRRGIHFKLLRASYKVSLSPPLAAPHQSYKK